MRHQNAGRKFDRNTSSRKAMFRNLAANLVLNERIETTDAKAKELRSVAERLITKARRLGEVAYTPQEKLSDADKAKRLATRPGGYTRIVKLGNRRGDNAPMVFIEFVGEAVKAEGEEKPAKKAKA